MIKTDNFESFCRVLESMVKCRIDILGYLYSQGHVRLVEAGKDLRVYHFFSVTGEKVRIAVGNDFLSVVPLELPEEKKTKQEK
ncbi:MAG: hypothetical protein GX894_08520 [Clostridia bacterium]|nr:hypothetical protein [Clostridia bacterium]